MDFLFSFWLIWITVSLRVVAVLRATLINVILIWAVFAVTLILLLPLIAAHDSARSVEGSLKYFIIQAFSGIVFLGAIISSFKSFYFLEATLLLKMGAFPFYIWVPHIYSGINYFSIGLLRTIMKFPRLVVLPSLSRGNIILFMAVARVLLGSIRGALLINLKALLRYSSVSHTGWLIILASQEFDWWAYYLIYMFMTILLISWLSKSNVKSINQIIKIPVFLTTGTMVLLISLSGIPPTIGFYVKLMALSRTSIICPEATLILSVSLVVRTYYYSALFLYSWLVFNKPLNKSTLTFTIRAAITLIIIPPLLL